MRELSAREIGGDRLGFRYPPGGRIDSKPSAVALARLTVVAVAAHCGASVAHYNGMDAEDMAALADLAASFAPAKIGVDLADGGQLTDFEAAHAAFAHSGLDLVEMPTTVGEWANVVVIAPWG